VSECAGEMKKLMALLVEGRLLHTEGEIKTLRFQSATRNFSKLGRRCETISASIRSPSWIRRSWRTALANGSTWASRGLVGLRRDESQGIFGVLARPRRKQRVI